MLNAYCAALHNFQSSLIQLIWRNRGFSIFCLSIGKCCSKGRWWHLRKAAGLVRFTSLSKWSYTSLGQLTIIIFNSQLRSAKLSNHNYSYSRFMQMMKYVSSSLKCFIRRQCKVFTFCVNSGQTQEALKVYLGQLCSWLVSDIGWNKLVTLKMKIHLEILFLHRIILFPSLPKTSKAS